MRLLIEMRFLKETKMGKIDQFISKELPQIKDKEEKERKTEEKLANLASGIKSYLDNYKKVFGINSENAMWYEFFKAYLSKIATSPREATYIEDFILKHISSLIEKCPEDEYFLEGTVVYGFWTFIYPAILFLLFIYLLLPNSNYFIWAGIAGGVLIPLASKKGRRVIPAYIFLLGLLWLFPDFFSNLWWFWKLAFLAIYSGILTLYYAVSYAMAKCAAVAFPISFEIVQELIKRLEE